MCGGNADSPEASNTGSLVAVQSTLAQGYIVDPPGREGKSEGFLDFNITLGPHRARAGPRLFGHGAGAGPGGDILACGGGRRGLGPARRCPRSPFPSATRVCVCVRARFCVGVGVDAFMCGGCICVCERERKYVVRVCGLLV